MTRTSTAISRAPPTRVKRRVSTPRNRPDAGEKVLYHRTLPVHAREFRWLVPPPLRTHLRAFEKGGERGRADGLQQIFRHGRAHCAHCRFHAGLAGGDDNLAMLGE